VTQRNPSARKVQIIADLFPIFGTMACYRALVSAIVLVLALAFAQVIAMAQGRHSLGANRSTGTEDTTTVDKPRDGQRSIRRCNVSCAHSLSYMVRGIEGE
jgi:hypothetical protein